MKYHEYQCPKCSAVIPRSERMQFVDDAAQTSIMVCIDCYDRMRDDDYAQRLAAAK